ncbi:MAG: DUF4870 domain-containing protein, partial [Gammaproteobacteria bacterium]
EEGRVETVEVTAAAGKRARLVVQVEIETPSAINDASSLIDSYRARYRFPLDYRVTDATGTVLIEQTSSIDWRDDTSDPSGRARQSSLVESEQVVGPEGGHLTARAVFPAFDVPDGGALVVTAARGVDTTYGASAVATRFRLEHDFSGRIASRLTLGLFMLVGGWVMAVIGFVLVMVGADSGAGISAPAELDPVAGQQVRNTAMFCHLAGLLGYVVPFGNVAGPLALWLMNRERHPYINEQGREALNFQLSILVYLLLAFSLVLALVGLVLLPVVILLQLTMTLLAAYRSAQGEAFRYPLTLRFIR